MEYAEGGLFSGVAGCSVGLGVYSDAVAVLG
jgi:hypothetical protein